MKNLKAILTIAFILAIAITAAEAGPLLHQLTDFPAIDVMTGCVSFAAVTKPCGNIAPGNQKLFAIACEDIETFTAPDPEGADPLLMTADIVPKTGKNFVEWVCENDTISTSGTLAGEVGYMLIEQMVAGTLRGDTKSNRQALYNAVGNEAVFIVLDSTGKYQVLGTKDKGLELTIGTTASGLSSAGEKSQATFEFKRNMSHFAYEYSGEVTLEPVP